MTLLVSLKWNAVCPKKCSGIISRVIEGETIVLNQRLGQVHQLNATATYVWQLCDGHTTIEQIVELVSREYGVPAGEIGEDVANIIAEFAVKELVENLDKKS